MFLLLLAALSNPAGAQITSTINVDSLQTLLPDAQGEERVDILNLISTHDG